MKIRELLSDESKWTQKHLARDADSNPVIPQDDTAVSFCLMGAMDRCYPHNRDNHRVYRKVAREVEQVGTWNDAPDRTFADVQALVTRLDI